MRSEARRAAEPGSELGIAVSALQRAWLRELGVAKLWQRAASAAVPAYTPAEPALVETPSPATTHHTAPEAPPALATVAVRTSTPITVRPDPVRLADLAQLDLNALGQQVQSCRACGLARGRKQAVFGAGVPAASWLIVGEAPGEQEDRQGLPFVGPSGQLLDAMLATVGRSRSRDVYIANVVKCRPPGNRNPKPEEIAACQPYLLRQIALVNPACILVVGRFAAQTLLNTEAPIASLRGRVHRLKTEGGREIPVVVSYHPAYLLRSPLEKAKAWADLQLALRAH